MSSQFVDLPLTGGIRSINGDKTPNQIIQGAGSVTVATVGGVTTITGTGTPVTASGQATLLGGTVTVTNAMVASGSVIFLSYAALSGVPGVLSIGTITAGVSFVINSSSTTDNSTVNWNFI